ncbi:aminotransferase class V-fold PLP-dependent enzyme [Nonomuraea sp. NPDC050643]|uniref:trans-sulfuration enzyme family protein n=1 Tax=Nonomuraea sp. NPDC050643 TaxID=3155660 RepID=UPI0034018E41
MRASSRIDTVAVRAGHHVAPDTGAITEPITMSVSFERDADGGHSRGYHYGAAGNPNRSALEHALAALEGGSEALTFASGSAAISAVLRTVLSPGAHVLLPRDVFQGTARLLVRLSEWGVDHDMVDMTSMDALIRAFRPNTALVWTETLSNPLLNVADIGAIASLAHRREAVHVVDNTFATPMFHQPLAFGADFVVHSSTKYLSGHGDVVGGNVILGDAAPHAGRLRELQWIDGAVPSPFDCWLTHRGLKTLPCRMRAHAANAARIAEFLAAHPQVIEVYYPGLAGSPSRTDAAALLGGYGGVVSFRVAGGRQGALRVAGAVELFRHATSLGSVDSLIQHQASAPTHGTGTALPDDLLRLSVGLEHADDLIDDLDQALNPC